MRKKILFILVVLLLFLTGCTSNTDKVSGTDSRFIKVNDIYKIGSIYYSIHYDSRTNIVYLADPQSYRSGISVMYNAEGEPMMLDEYYETR